MEKIAMKFGGKKSDEATPVKYRLVLKYKNSPGTKDGPEMHGDLKIINRNLRERKGFVGIMVFTGEEFIVCTLLLKLDDGRTIRHSSDREINLFETPCQVEGVFLKNEKIL